ncbi:hypothetical protein [Chromobacterium sp. IIBBL 290-4]|uniref:hypothetical protein n=1 Tax=Chromobacterium sp. IIBBL 290-4 TaxID=2953890 RepID=UPI0020B8E7CA|nr:hypothetical protein [Chromobacterium sp. IIBBL 290-4]UTH72233.1 hypothetical protein NKT35_11765 [Chromobacterium sp. IIBBL 290-4]
MPGTNTPICGAPRNPAADIANPLTIAAGQIACERRLKSTICADDASVASYGYGGIEGELAYALAASTSTNVRETIEGCQEQLLLRLGLTSRQGLTIEQQRLRGWITGLFAGMFCAVEDLEEDAL